MNKLIIVVFAAMFAVFCGCESIGNEIYGSPPPPFPTPTETGIIPNLGHYLAAGVVDNLDIARFRQYGFEVVADTVNPGVLVVSFTNDGYRYDNIPIKNGAFRFTHGGGADNTNFPTDGYFISGSFITATEAQGYFQDCPDGFLGHGGDYVANLDH